MCCPSDFPGTPALDEAINSADVFVFETNLGYSTAEFHYFMDHQGHPPRGPVDYLRPGVAVFLLELRRTARCRSSRALTPRLSIMRKVKANNWPISKACNRNSSF